MKILCMGQITYDYVLTIDGFPIEGLKYNLKEKKECPGGSACNASYLLAKWNEEVYLSAAVGGDEIGNKIKKDLDEAGVKSHSVEVNFESKTPISFVLVNKNNSQKTTFAISEKDPHVKKCDFDFVPEIILLDGYEYTSGISVVNKYPNAITILDASEYTKPIVELCKYAKYIIASKKFAEEYTGIKVDYNNPTTLLEMYKKLAMKYPNSNLIITLKERGAMFLDNNQIKVMPGLKKEVIVDSTGAGDIFRAAFAAGLSKGFDIEKNIRLCNIAAGLSLDKMGFKDSLPLFSDVMSYYESKFGKENQAPVQNQTTPETVQTQVQANTGVQPEVQSNTSEGVQQANVDETPVPSQNAPVNATQNNINTPNAAGVQNNVANTQVPVNQNSVESNPNDSAK